MKTLTILSFLAAVAAFALSLINIEVAGTLLLGTGLLGIMSADYSRRAPLVELPLAPVLPLRPVSRPVYGAFELAA